MSKTTLCFIFLCFGVFIIVVHEKIHPHDYTKQLYTNTLQTLLDHQTSFQSQIPATRNEQSVVPLSTTSQIPVHKNPQNTPLKRIVLWNKFFNKDDWYTGFPKGSRQKEISCFNDRSRCVLSIERTKPLMYDAVVFHGRDGFSVPKQRSPHQVYIMYLWESPAHRGGSFNWSPKFYNWTSTYSTKSDITMKHGSWFRLPKRDENALKRLPQLQKSRENGRATVLWIVSNCRASSRRDLYVTKLRRHIKVDIFGGCGKPCPNHTGGNSVSCFRALGERGQYKFYLAFENSACPDYISIKPFRALNSTMVPIVLGGTSANDYKGGLFPPNAYLDVRNFTSPKHLAEYLKYLDTHNDVYLSYHEWRKEYWVDPRLSPLTFCQICDALYNTTMTKPRNVNWSEFWHPKKCEWDLVQKLLAHHKKITNSSSTKV